MSVNLSPVAGAAAQFLDNSGNVLTGGKLYTYLAGTTTPAATYTSSLGVSFHSNPIILDAAGRVSNGGEIWLADNVSYKFVLKDSNDVLIGTWDNLIGINSNFVNYSVQEEIQTATAGQTVFNLSTITYNPGTNSLSVYVDGVNQYDGASYAYIETNANTVTFTAGLHVGALVKFTTAVPTTGNSTNANLVTYDPPFANAVSTTVENKLAQTVSFKDFGAVGDGVTDDTVAVQNALNSSAYVIEGQGLNYKLSTTVTSTVTHRINNATFSGTTAANNPYIKFIGSSGSAQTLAANLNKNSYSVTVPDGSLFTQYQWVYFRSTQQWSTAMSCTVGELCKIKSIVGNVLTLYTATMFDYTTGNAGSVLPITMLNDVVLDNVSIQGDTGVSNQTGIWLEMCNGLILNSISENCQNAHINLRRCGFVDVIGGICNRTGTAVGLNYGVVVERACYSSLITGYSTTNCRHTVTIGGSEGINKYTKAHHCVSSGGLESGFDSHVGAMYVDYSFNTITPDAAATSFTGVNCQGANFTAIGNVMHNAAQMVLFNPKISVSGINCTGTIALNKGYGIYNTANTAINVFTTTGFSNEISNVIIDGNYTIGCNYMVGLYANGNPIQNVTISNNSADTVNFSLVYVYAQTANITRVNVTGNTANGTVGNRLLYLRADNTYTIDSGSVTNNRVKVSANEGILLQGISTGRIKNIAVNGNYTEGPGTTIGLRLYNTDNVTTDGTNNFNHPTNPVSIDTGGGVSSSNYNLRETNLVPSAAFSNIYEPYIVIASNTVAIPSPTTKALKLDTEGLAAADDLDTVNGGYTGQMITISSNNAGRNITVKDNVGNLNLNGDFVLISPFYKITLQYDLYLGKWFELSRSAN